MQMIFSPAADPDVIHEGGSSPANDGRTCMKEVMQWCSENLCKVTGWYFEILLNWATG